MSTKSGKLSKLSSAFRKSLSKLGHSPSSNSISPTANTNPSARTTAVDEDYSAPIPALGCQTVYVGKCRRAYQISNQVIEHPSFQGLICRARSDGSDEDDNTITLTCEVVLFEHLLWMLESMDPQAESLDDLLEFYA